MLFGKAAKVRLMREPIYRVHFDTFACRVRATANDCPVFAISGKRSLKTVITCNAWLLHGENYLKILIEPPAGRDTLDKDKAFLRGKVTAGDMTVPQAERAEVVLVEFELDLAMDTGTYPLVLEERFDVPTAFPGWIWTRAPGLTVDVALRAEAAGVVREVWNALQRKDLDRVLELQRVRLRELSQSMFQPIDERIADTRTDLTRLTGDPAGRLRPLNADEYVYALFAQGRLVRVNDARDYPVIRYDFPDTALSAGIPLFYARNEYGHLAWVR